MDDYCGMPDIVTEWTDKINVCRGSYQDAMDKNDRSRADMDMDVKTEPFTKQVIHKCFIRRQAPVAGIGQMQGRGFMLNLTFISNAFLR